MQLGRAKQLAVSPQGSPPGGGPASSQRGHKPSQASSRKGRPGGKADGSSPASTSRSRAAATASASTLAAPLAESAAALSMRAEALTTEIARIEKEAKAAATSTFERVLGGAILAKLGPAGKVDDLMDEWDRNKDKAISKGEWRQAVRD